MFKASYKVATVWGIPINIHISLLVLLLFVAVQGAIAEGPIGFVFSLVLGVAVFASIALHELGHSFVALRKGCRVREITLMFIGGVAKMESIPSRPMDEFQMAIAGPLVSLAIGIMGFIGGLALHVPNRPDIGFVILFVGGANLILVGFNLIPAFPMDGGRVLRALLTPKLGRLKATFIASRIGRIVAVILGIIALTPQPFIHPVTGIAIAFFIFIAAGQEYKLVQMQEAMKQQSHGYGFYPWESSSFHPQGPPGPPPRTNDQVTISPPPYQDGPDTRASIESEEEEDPFGLFRRR